MLGLFEATIYVGEVRVCDLFVFLLIGDVTNPVGRVGFYLFFQWQRELSAFLKYLSKKHFFEDVLHWSKIKKKKKNVENMLKMFPTLI